MKKIVVFGGAGFLGSHMVDYLNCKYKNRVFSFDLKPHSSLPAEKNIIGDISDKELVKSALKGTHTVFNYIAVSDIEECIRDPLKAAQINICGNAVLMEACIEEKVHRFVFASSVYAESSLGGVYRTTKMASESLIKDYNKYYDLDYTILRYGTVYGPGSDERNSVHRFVSEALKKKKIFYHGSGEERREYIHVYDAARLSEIALGEEYKNQTLTLTGHKSLKVKDLFAIIREILNDDVEVELQSKQSEELLNSHYKTTPYSYKREISSKLVGTQYVDIGAGILQCIREQESAKNKKA